MVPYQQLQVQSTPLQTTRRQKQGLSVGLGIQGITGQDLFCRLVCGSDMRIQDANGWCVGFGVQEFESLD